MAKKGPDVGRNLLACHACRRQLFARNSPHWQQHATAGNVVCVGVRGGVCVCVCVRGGKCMCVREGGNERKPECVWGVCGYVPACVVCVSARACVCGGENNHCNPAILFNEEWKAGIQRCGYVPHINVCSVDILPLFRWVAQERSPLQSSHRGSRSSQGNISSLNLRTWHPPLRRRTSCCLTRRKSWSHGYDVWVLSKR